MQEAVLLGWSLRTEVKHGPALGVPRTVDRGADCDPALQARDTLIMTQPTRFVGIDVSMRRLDVRCPDDGLAFAVANTAEGIAKLIAHTRTPGTVYGCEASGGHEARLLMELTRHGLECLCLHPADVRAFCRLAGRRAKTDALDAVAIAGALKVAIQSRKPVARTAVQNRLRELATVRTRLTVALTQFKSLKAAMVDEEALGALEHTIAHLKQHIATLTASMKRAIAADDASRQKAARITSVPGAGPVLAAQLIASMPELGSMSAKQAASLAGLAPHPNQSGSTCRPGRCQGGRANVRKVLYMAALSLIKAQKEPFFGNYQRLRQNGKPFKLAITAIMRKLIVTINAVEKRQTMWKPDHQTHAQ